MGRGIRARTGGLQVNKFEHTQGAQALAIGSTSEQV